jgi:hypothetical protein
MGIASPNTRGWTVRAAEVALELFKEWDAQSELEDFAAERFVGKYTEEEIALGIAIFEEIGGVADATDLLDMLKSVSPNN